MECDKVFKSLYFAVKKAFNFHVIWKAMNWSKGPID